MSVPLCIRLIKMSYYLFSLFYIALMLERQKRNSGTDI